MKKAILIVSFGTTYPGTRQKNITAIREQVQALYPDVLIEEAVSSTIVRKAMRTREDIEAKSPAEGLEALKECIWCNDILIKYVDNYLLRSSS